MTEEVSEHGASERIKIQIDRVHYDVEESRLTGAQLRMLPEPHIGEDRDLFEVVPGHSDRKITDAEMVELRNGTRFFTAPAHINPGLSGK